MSHRTVVVSNNRAVVCSGCVLKQALSTSCNQGASMPYEFIAVISWIILCFLVWGVSINRVASSVIGIII